MNEQLEDLTMALSDAGCGADAIEKAKRLWAAGRTEDLIRHLRLCRCELMDDLHACQKRVDCLDYLIRQTKTIKTNEGKDGKNHDQNGRTEADPRMGQDLPAE